MKLMLFQIECSGFETMPFTASSWLQFKIVCSCPLHVKLIPIQDHYILTINFPSWQQVLTISSGSNFKLIKIEENWTS